MTKTKSVRTRVQTVTCPGCKLEMYSRARHDYRLCGCDFQTMVDGGFDYLRCGGKSLDALIHKVRYVNATKYDLYQDWNKSLNKFGVIKEKK